MNKEPKLEVIELRNYLLVPGKTNQFIHHFDEHFIDSQKELGGYVLKEYKIPTEPDRFFWIRGFKNMKERSRFLPAFYEKSAAWQTFGPAANLMMREWHNVHLLRSAFDDQVITGNSFSTWNGITVVEYYVAKKGLLEELIGFFNSTYHSFLKKNGSTGPNYWISETTANDFPRLPVIQDDHLFVSISSFENEAAYKKRINEINNDEAIDSGMQQLISSRQTIILSPAVSAL
jgi:hypothetical protein